MSKQAMTLALEALQECRRDPRLKYEHPTYDKAIKALEEALAKQEHMGEPVGVDQNTMKLAESVGLIGPASRSDDLHAAIQRFHDLTCANATIKAAKMAADVISAATPQPKQEQGKSFFNFRECEDSQANQPKQEQGEPVADHFDCGTYIGSHIGKEIRHSIGDDLPPQRKPLTDDIWILTSEYNDYDQHGEYFEAVFIGKPTAEQIEKHCGVNEVGSTHILAGGGRVEYEYHWYNLRKEKAAHGINEKNT
jgi:hypothetical protein